MTDSFDIRNCFASLSPSGQHPLRGAGGLLSLCSPAGCLRHAISAALRFAVLGSTFGIALGPEHADTAMRDSAIHPREAALRNLSAAKDNRFMPIYEFADEDNTKITHLDPFAERFLKKCDLGRTISRYMVLLAGEQKLMIMRPYQVYAVQHMVKCIDDDDGDGFVWHTTGSGKTLTSFKASTLRDTLLPKLLSGEVCPSSN